MESEKLKIYCCGCKQDVEARLTDGSEIYAHRKYLASLPFWICDSCKNFVGCHHKTKNRTKPLGVIPTADIKDARKHIHALLDPMWESGAIKRKSIYLMLTEKFGKQYHTAEIRSIDEARLIYREIKSIKEHLETIK